MDDPAVRALSAVAALDEPTRRRLYEYVVRQPEPVGRDEVAAATAVARATVAFHLDKLVAEHLLDVTYERRTGRTGPGAGRPAKLYHRSDRQVTVSLPARRYDLAGHLLAAALEEAGRSGCPPGPILREHARRLGEELGAAAGSVLRTLTDHGFEPRADGSGVVLGNCPFHRLAESHTELVCGMNLGLVKGLLHGAGDPSLRAELAPTPGHCCVRLTRTSD
ncbi:MAG: transcriptional regulator [Actinophytocola sp.]|uniref:helix-turn-helix transcriptional regulator n=1 Tax=Actinophytocola sp. TaxID=1872138 RepID=UPI0013288D4A|nr:helix-turn-helix domain-containing protein [Actinophytocola sp.]MPZ85417.1 transcriptional regulator [Actinophytocola sp.]